MRFLETSVFYLLLHQYFMFRFRKFNKKNNSITKIHLFYFLSKKFTVALHIPIIVFVEKPSPFDNTIVYAEDYRTVEEENNSPIANHIIGSINGRDDIVRTDKYLIFTTGTTTFVPHQIGNYKSPPKKKTNEAILCLWKFCN